MGHDIYAYRSEQARDDEHAALNAGMVGLEGDAWAAAYDGIKARFEIGYLRYNAFNQSARSIYDALNAEDCDCGCSGCGEGRHFTREELVAAVKSLPPDDNLRASVTFLWDCINKGGETGAYIFFG